MDGDVPVCPAECVFGSTVGLTASAAVPLEQLVSGDVVLHGATKPALI